MKRTLLAMAMTLALPALILCQTNGKSTDKKGGSEQAVRQALNDLTAGLRNNDTAVLNRIYADNYTFVGDTGEIMTKAQRIAAWRYGNGSYPHHDQNGTRLEVHGW